MNKLEVSMSDKYNQFMMRQVILYGDAFVDWVEKEGMTLFFKWAESQGLEFVDFPNKNPAQPKTKSSDHESHP